MSSRRGAHVAGAGAAASCTRCSARGLTACRAPSAGGCKGCAAEDSPVSLASARYTAPPPSPSVAHAAAAASAWPPSHTSSAPAHGSAAAESSTASAYVRASSRASARAPESAPASADASAPSPPWEAYALGWSESPAAFFAAHGYVVSSGPVVNDDVRALVLAKIGEAWNWYVDHSAKHSEHDEAWYLNEAGSASCAWSSFRNIFQRNNHSGDYTRFMGMLGTVAAHFAADGTARAAFAEMEGAVSRFVAGSQIFSDGVKLQLGAAIVSVPAAASATSEPSPAQAAAAAQARAAGGCAGGGGGARLGRDSRSGGCDSDEGSGIRSGESAPVDLGAFAEPLHPLPQPSCPCRAKEMGARGGVLVRLANAACDGTKFDNAVISILPTLPSTPEGLLGAGAEVRARLAAAATTGEGRNLSGAAKAGVAAETLRGVAADRGSSTVGTNAAGGRDDEGTHSGADADAGYGAGAGDDASARADGAEASAAALIAAAKTATDRVGDRAPLHVVEIFAGCGGLGHGLASVEGMRSLLAVERDAGVAAIHALNMGADATVLCVDASTFLEALLRRSDGSLGGGGAAAAAGDVGLSREDAAWVLSLNSDRSTGSVVRPSTAAPQSLPSPPPPPSPTPRPPLQPVRPARPTRVDVLAGGSPCQGFSGANREVNVDVRAQTNVLVSTYVSALERLRPDYGVFENVPPLATHPGSSRGSRQSVLRFMLAALLEAGYQCRVAQVDAAQGLCQTRTRLVMLVAAPGVRLLAFPRPLHTAASLDGGVALELHLLTGRGVAPPSASRAPRGAREGEGTVANAGAGATDSFPSTGQSGRRTRGASGTTQRTANEAGAIVTVAAHFSAPSPSAPLRTPTLGDVLRGLPNVGNDAVVRALSAGPQWRRNALPPSPSPFDLALREGVETLAGGRANPCSHDRDGSGAGTGADARATPSFSPVSSSSSSSSSTSSSSSSSSSSSASAAAAASAELLTPTARDHFSRALQGLDLARALCVPTDHPGADWRNLPNVEVLGKNAGHAHVHRRCSKHGANAGPPPPPTPPTPSTPLQLAARVHMRPYS